MMARLQARHAELSAALPPPSTTRMEPTGQTFRQSWESMSLKERRLWLLDAGVSVIARRGATPSSTLPVGPLEAEEVPRFVLADDGDVHAVVLLGGLAGLLRRIHA